MQIFMKFKKGTKNKFVFAECDEMGEVTDPVAATIPSLYIAKISLNGPAQFITVTVDLGIQVDTDA